MIKKLLCRIGTHGPIKAHSSHFDTYHDWHDEECTKCGKVRRVTNARLPRSIPETRTSPWFCTIEEMVYWLAG